MSSTSAPAGNDAPLSLRDTADALPDDAFGHLFDGEDDGPETTSEAAVDVEPEAPPPPRPRGDKGRFAPRAPSQEDGQSETPDDATQVEEPDGQDRATDETPEGADKPAEQKADDKPGSFIEVDGQRITPETFREHAMMRADYTRKTQEVAEARKGLHAEAEQYAAGISSARQQLLQAQQFAQAVVQRYAPQPPPISLLHSDPNLYHEQKAYYEQASQDYSALQGQFQQLTAQEQAEMQRRQQAAQEGQRLTTEQEQQHLQREFNALREKLPALRTAEGADGWVKKASAYAARYGRSAHDVLQALGKDHVNGLMLEDAMLGAAVREKRATTSDRVKAAPPIQPQARPGQGNRQGQAQRERAERFEKEPTIGNLLGKGTLDRYIF